MKFLAFSQTKFLGSSLALPANGLGGSRATSSLVAHFALQNTASNLAEKNRALPPPKADRHQQKGKKEGGLGEGIFALLRLRIERFRFSLIKRNAKQKNFLFFLKEKIEREKIKKCRENFSVLVCRSEAEVSGNAPHSCSGFSLKKVRISFRVRSKAQFYARLCLKPKQNWATGFSEQVLTSPAMLI